MLFSFGRYAYEEICLILDERDRNLSKYFYKKFRLPSCLFHLITQFIRGDIKHTRRAHEVDHCDDTIDATICSDESSDGIVLSEILTLLQNKFNFLIYKAISTSTPLSESICETIVDYTNPTALGEDSSSDDEQSWFSESSVSSAWMTILIS